MTLIPPSEPVPLRAEANGDLRIGGSRVLLDLVVHAFDAGATPETIVQNYPSLQLPDVYAVIAYYLRHRTEVQEYLRQGEKRAEEVRRRIETSQPVSVSVTPG